MNAGLSLGVAFDNRAAHTPVLPGGVLSVSPRLAGIARALERPAVAALPVVDPGALDELASSLRSLVAEAAGAARRLMDGLSHARSAESRARSTEARAEEAAAALHDRLRLGAGMLKAIDAQIDRVDSAAAESLARQEQISAALDRLDDHFRALQGRLDEMVADFERRLQETAAATAAQLEQHVQAIAAQLAARQAPTRIGSIP
jgi:chromosome segregation ATPase